MVSSLSEAELSNSHPALFAQLTQLRPLLETQGVIQRRGGTYRLRYRYFDADAGFTQHKSIALPTDEIMGNVLQLLSVWREQRQAQDAEEEQLRQNERKVKDVTAKERQLVQAIVAAHGGGSRRKQRAADMFDAAIEAGPMEMLRFSLSGNFVKAGKPGRPRKQRMFYAGWGK